MNRDVLKVSLKSNAIVIPQSWIVNPEQTKMNQTTGLFVVKCAELGYAVSEPLLQKINGISPKMKLEIIDFLEEVTGVNKNWTPLVKQWDIPTGESVLDHIIVMLRYLSQTLTEAYIPIVWSSVEREIW